MYKDPIVKEVRDAGALLAEESNYDIQKFFDNLRKSQKKYISRIINKSDFHKVQNGITSQPT